MVGLVERASLAGFGGSLDVAQAISAYLDRANGDTRLALAFSVADSIAVSKLVSPAYAPTKPQWRSPASDGSGHGR